MVAADNKRAGIRGDTAMLLTGQLARMGVQGAYFVLLARGLGAQVFGASAALLALVALLVPFSSLGAALILVKNVSRAPETAAVQWSNTMLLTVGSGGCLTGLLVLTSPWIAPPGLTSLVIVAVGVGDLICARLVDGAAGAFQALERMARTAYFPVILHSFRLLGLVVLVEGPWAFTLTSWAVSYVVTSVPVAAIIALATLRRVGRARPSLSRFFSEWRQGALFSIGMSSQTIYNDIDKVMLARLSTLQATGIYSAAYRIVDMSYAPVRALIASAYPSMWRAGQHGVTATLSVVRAKLWWPTAAYCLIGSLAMFLGADLAPMILGSSFETSVPALRALSMLLLLKGCHFIAADTLTASDHQTARTIVQVTIAAANIFLSLILIQYFSWRGAVVASLVSDGLLVVILWGLVWRYAAVERRSWRSTSLRSPKL